METDGYEQIKTDGCEWIEIDGSECIKTDGYEWIEVVDMNGQKSMDMN